MMGRPIKAGQRVAICLALLLATGPSGAVQAWQVTPPDPATAAAMQRRIAARTLLSSGLARIAANANDALALLDAGRASIALEDFRAALNFLTRAEQASPRDGAVKAALGVAMVHMENPTRALDYFGEAQLLGAPERLFLSDRALARDLLGQQDAAQRDYQLALSIAADDETQRRYAVSLGISGEPDRGVQLLTNQLRAQDRGAWRTRALILAINGRHKEAVEIVNATMPPALAENILPYLSQLDRLNPAQQAAAAHFGRFPAGNLAPPRTPVQIATATPPSGPSVKGPTGRNAAQQVRGTVKPENATPPPVAVRRQTLSPQVAAVATPKPQSPAVPANAAPPPTSTSARDPAIAAPVARPPAAPPAAIQVGEPNTAPIGVAVRENGPVGPGFSIAEIAQTAAPNPNPNPKPKPADAAVSEVVTAPAATAASASGPPLASLADIFGSLAIPPEEMQRADGAIDAVTLARLQEEKRKAEAAAEAQREKEAAAAKAKADLDAKAKAQADAKAKAKAEADAKAKAEADAKKAHPARLWVQIATGSNEKALAFDYNRFAKKNAALFKGKSGATAEWGRTRRLLVGPFGDRKAAQTWLDGFKKAEGDGFLFSSVAGEAVDPIK